MCTTVWILSIFFLTCQQEFVSTFYVSENETTWNNYPCRLAKPDIKIAKDGKLFVKETHGINGDNMWIGVYLAPKCFTYVGCDVLGETKDSFTVNNVGDCSFACSCMAFGIRKNKKTFDCMCVNEVNRPPHTTCSTCESGDEMFACGTENRPYFSIYTSESETDSFCDDCNAEGSCLSFRYNETGPRRLFDWISCDQKNSYRVLCSNMPFTESPVNAVYPSRIRFTSKWIDASNSCFSDSHYPSSYRSITETKFNVSFNQLHWTGILRMSSIRTLDEYGPSCTEAFGYVKKNKDGIYEVKFENDNSNDKNSLCQKDPATDILQEKCDTLSIISPSTLPSSGKSAILAGVLVPMTLLVVVILIILAIKKRDMLRSFISNRVYGKNKRQSRSKPSQDISNPVLDSTTNTEQDLKNSVTSRSYLVLEKPIQGASEYVATDAEPYAVPSDTFDNYDTLNEPSDSEHKDDYDHANTAHLVNDLQPTVNSTDADHVYNTVPVTDANDYDHIAKQCIVPDNDYETTAKMANETVDEYNHLGINGNCSSKTDNPYNIPDNANDDTDYNSVHMDFESRKLNCGDDYDKLNIGS